MIETPPLNAVYEGVITPFSPDSIGMILEGLNSTSRGSGAYPTANKAFFVPFLVARRRTAYKMASFNGSTAAGNLDMGLYDAAGNRLASTGSTAQSGTTTVQIIDITDVLLTPGNLYYMAIASDSTSLTLARNSGPAPQSQVGGMLSQTSAMPLPNPATFAQDGAVAYLPLFGVVTRSYV